MRKIKMIGLDMDHTLVRYKTKEFETLAYTMMLEKLIRLKKYPEEIKNLKFDFESVVRGLIIDSQKGNLLKVSRHGAIRVSRHGSMAIDYQKQKMDYRGTYVDLGDPNFAAIDTSFSISVAALYSQIIDMKDTGKFENIPSYPQILKDTIEVMDLSHRDDSLKSIVRANLDKYIIRDPLVVEGLEKHKQHGKTIFIVTNSDFHYTKTLLEYSIDPFLKKNKNWQELFTYVITSARKPRFFYDKQDFLKVNPADGSMTNYDKKLEPGVYQGGCADLFEMSVTAHAEDILYIGDHIYGDILRLKKDCQWRTALVVEELDEEIAQMRIVKPYQDEIRELMLKKMPKEDELVKLSTEDIEKSSNNSKRIDHLHDEIAQIDKQISPLIKKTQETFNSYWGEIMRSGNEESYFAYQVDRFADIYMPKLSDLLIESPRSYFRAPRRPLAHEISLSLTIEHT